MFPWAYFSVQYLNLKCFVFNQQKEMERGHYLKHRNTKYYARRLRQLHGYMLFKTSLIFIRKTQRKSQP